MRLAFDHAVMIALGEGLAIPVAPPPVLTVLKMVAYLDSPYDRAKDLGDIAWILEGFVGPAADERFADEIFELGLQDEEVSPLLLGRRVAEIAGEPEVEAVRLFLDVVLERARPSPALGEMARQGPPRLRADIEEAIKRVRAFERGFAPRAHAGSPP